MDRDGADGSPESTSRVEPSSGTKPGDIAQGGEDLKPVASEALDKAP
jgi:hypothetical protein